MSHLTVEDKQQLRFEEAQVVWSSGKGAIDVATNSVARQLLGMLLKDLRTSENGKQFFFLFFFLLVVDLQSQCKR